MPELYVPAPSRVVNPPLTFNADIPGTGDIKVLNYALSAEALEVALYTQSLQRLTTGGTNVIPAGATTPARTVAIPGLNLADTEPDVAFVRGLVRREIEHRNFLNAALGANSILASNSPFSRAGFDFGIESLTRQQVVTLLYIQGIVGIAAYTGSVPFFATKTFLPIAGGIQAVEARHASGIAYVLNLLFNAGVPTAPLAGRPVPPLTAGNITINFDAQRLQNSSGIETVLLPDDTLAIASQFIVLPGR